MRYPPIRHVPFAVLVLAAVGQIGFAAALSDSTNGPVEGRSAFANEPLAVESLEWALVRAMWALDVPGLLVVAGALKGGGDPPDNEVRGAIRDTVEEESVIRFTSLAADLDVPTSTVRYHVRVLNNASVVDVETIWGKRWLSSPTVERADVVLAATLDDEALTSIFESLRERDSASVSELAAALDRAPSTVSYHLQRLENADLVERERDGSSVRTSLADGIPERLHEEL